MMTRLIRPLSLIATGVTCLMPAAGQAIVLAPADVAGGIAISFFDYGAYLSAPGTTYLVPHFVAGANSSDPGCNDAGYCNLGTGEASAKLGVDSSVFLSATPANDGGGGAALRMSYYFEYSDPGAPYPTLKAINVHASDVLHVSGDSAAEASATVAAATGLAYSAYDCAANAGFACHAGGAPFHNATVDIYENVVYTVFLSVDIYSHDPVSVLIDPSFSAATPSPGEFIYSPGVISDAPEPATWALLLAGFGGVGVMARRRRAATAPN